MLCDISLSFYRPFPFGPLLNLYSKIHANSKKHAFSPFLFASASKMHALISYLVVSPHFLTNFCDAAGGQMSYFPGDGEIKKMLSHRF